MTAQRLAEQQVAALFGQIGGCYFGLAGCNLIDTSVTYRPMQRGAKP
jgi:hypothetical protein